MPVSAFDLFRISVGPSSSHPVGPMRAALRFVQDLAAEGALDRVHRLQVQLHGSLGLTGRGHATDRAVLLGLAGQAPHTVDVEEAEALVVAARQRRQLTLAGRRIIEFDEARDLVFHAGKSLPQHPNGMRFFAYDAAGALLAQRTMFSIGGGFIADARELAGPKSTPAVPYPYRSAVELLALCALDGLSIAELVWRNEVAAVTASP